MTNPNDARTPELSASEDDRAKRVRDRAYELFEARGGEHGYDLEDWLAAERDVPLVSHGEALIPDAQRPAASHQTGGSNGQIREDRSEEGRASAPRTQTRNTEERVIR